MKMREKIEELSKENRFLKTENKLIKEENDKIYQENEWLCKRCLRLENKVDKLKAEKEVIQLQNKTIVDELQRKLKKYKTLLNVYKNNVEEVSIEELLEEI